MGIGFTHTVIAWFSKLFGAHLIYSVDDIETREDLHKLRHKIFSSSFVSKGYYLVFYIFLWLGTFFCSLGRYVQYSHCYLK